MSIGVMLILPNFLFSEMGDVVNTKVDAAAVLITGETTTPESVETGEKVLNLMQAVPMFLIIIGLLMMYVGKRHA